jgi:hypothetical protein
MRHFAVRLHSRSLQRLVTVILRKHSDACFRVGWWFRIVQLSTTPRGDSDKEFDASSSVNFVTVEIKMSGDEIGGATLILLGIAIIVCCFWITLRPIAPVALLDRFPGPVTIGVSIPKNLLFFVLSAPLLFGAILCISSSATLANGMMHGHFRGQLLPRLLVLMHLARDTQQALAQIGWAVVVFIGIGSFRFIRKLALSVTGSWGLKLDQEGFNARTLRTNRRWLWRDVGDFDSVAVSSITRQQYRMMPNLRRCLIFNDYRGPDSPVEWLRATGRNRGLREGYEYSAEDLAVIMSAWRKKALEKPRSTSTPLAFDSHTDVTGDETR